jgi:hypothetical protein
MLASGLMSTVGYIFMYNTITDVCWYFRSYIILIIQVDKTHEISQAVFYKCNSSNLYLNPVLTHSILAKQTKLSLLTWSQRLKRSQVQVLTTSASHSDKDKF